MRNLLLFKKVFFILVASCFVPLFSTSTSLAALLVDDCEGVKNQLDGGWSSYVDAHSTASPLPFKMSAEGYQSGQCARLEFELKTGVQYPYAGFNTYFKGTDVSQYEGVRFWARGAGNWTFQIPIPATATEYNHFASPFDLTEKWALVEVPFSSLSQTWGTIRPWDPSAITGVQWSASGLAGAKGWICVDNVEFYKKDETQMKPPEANPILPEPKVNQLGYLPEAPKYFVVSEVPGGPKKGDAFKILDDKGKTAFSGTLETDSVDDKASTGEKVFQGDFSALNKPGLYTVGIKGLKSHLFEIKKDLYRPLLKDALRCFYTIRCGVAIDDKVLSLKHEACHTKDAPPLSGGERVDLTGGWHNAADFGKWVHMESMSTSWMMWLYEFREKQMAGLKIDIPESINKTSDLLDQARWGLDWMLKMQMPDGSVLHKVDAENQFCTGTVPEKDPHPRFSKKPGSIDAGDFIGAMCQASRVFRKEDSAFADKCLAAAKKTWKWLEQNPNVLEHDPNYTDKDASQERLWALGEMARTTGDKALLQRFDKEAPPGQLKYVNWMEPQFFGYMALCFGPETPAEQKKAIRTALAGACDNLAQAAEANGYGVAHAANEYWWESNENLLNKTNLLLFGYEATGNARYREAALKQMNWLLGTNGLNFSFVTGHGENSVKHPWHWTMDAFGKLMPGWVSGGPNRYPAGADSLLTTLIKRGTPPAKCYVDANTPNGSWASNEGETSANASLVFAAGYLSGE